MNIRERNARLQAMEALAPTADLTSRDRTLFRLIDANIVGVATCDADGRILEANDAYLDMLGYTRDDLTSGRLAWRELTPPEWKDVSMKAVAEIQATGRCQAFEKEYFRKDGTRVPILIASAAIDDSHGQIVGFVLDLSARKRAEGALERSEAYLAEAQRLTRTGSWAVNPATEQSSYWSEEMFRIFERDRSAGGLDHPGLLHAMHPADRNGFSSIVGDAMRINSDFTVEFRIALSGGRTKHLRKIGHPILDEAGAVVEWVGTIVDITDRKTAEDERTRLAGEIHDTLAQALAMIVMQLADVEAKLGPEWARAEKPLSMVRELAVESLAYARRSVNMVRPTARAGELARSLRDVVDSLAKPFGGSMHLTVNGESALFDETVESTLVAIAREAITNAVKHSNAARIAVDLDFATAGAVRLVVSDDGSGFDPNAVPKDGYGLVSMQERAARSHVALTFVTEPGAGTTMVASWSPTD